MLYFANRLQIYRGDDGWQIFQERKTPVVYFRQSSKSDSLHNKNITQATHKRALNTRASKNSSKTIGYPSIPGVPECSVNGVVSRRNSDVQRKKTLQYYETTERSTLRTVPIMNKQIHLTTTYIPRFNQQALSLLVCRITVWWPKLDQSIAFSRKQRILKRSR